MTPREFATKVEWEDGLYEAVTSYGLSENDLNRDDDPELYDEIETFTKKARELSILESHIADRLEAYNEI